MRSRRGRPRKWAVLWTDLRFRHSVPAVKLYITGHLREIVGIVDRCQGRLTSGRAPTCRNPAWAVSSLTSTAAGWRMPRNYRLISRPGTHVVIGGLFHEVLELDFKHLTLWSGIL